MEGSGKKLGRTVIVRRDETKGEEGTKEIGKSAKVRRKKI